MSHIRSLSVERSVLRTEDAVQGAAPALSLSAPLLDLLADLNAAVSLLVYRKKFEPLPNPS